MQIYIADHSNGLSVITVVKDPAAHTDPEAHTPKQIAQFTIETEHMGELAHAIVAHQLGLRPTIEKPIEEGSHAHR